MPPGWPKPRLPSGSRYMKLRLALLTLVLALSGGLAATLPAGSAYALTSRDIERELMCQCGCTMVVDVCDCDQAVQIRALISEKIGQGQSKDQIINFFVAKYGEKMLSSPPKKGFNLVAWIGPFAAVLAGGTALFFVLRTWARKGRAGAQESVVLMVPESPQESETYRIRLEDELRRFREEGST